jgi:hypothetical protein
MLYLAYHNVYVFNMQYLKHCIKSRITYSVLAVQNLELVVLVAPYYNMAACIYFS